MVGVRGVCRPDLRQALIGWRRKEAVAGSGRRMIGSKEGNKLKNNGSRYWLSFDLGLQGDYEALYSWLDKQKARECGSTVATFVSKKTRDQIVRELSGILDPKKKQRIYIINMKQGGRFILGNRAVAPWTGYAQVSLESEEER